MHDAFAVKIHETGGELGHPKAYYVLGKVALAIEVIYHDVMSTLRHEKWEWNLTSQITTPHEVENEETVLIILESVAEVDQERVVDLDIRGEELDSACEEAPHLLQ
jgi:hypothetical protein